MKCYLQPVGHNSNETRTLYRHRVSLAQLGDAAEMKAQARLRTLEKRDTEGVQKARNVPRFLFALSSIARAWVVG